MFKLLGSLLTFFLGTQLTKTFSFKSIGNEIFNQIALYTRKPVALFLAGLLSIIFFSGGAFMAIVNATSQYDLMGTVTGTATLWTGAGLAAFFLVSYTWIFMVAWPGAENPSLSKGIDSLKDKISGNEIPSLDKAISAFVIDIVEQRKVKRSRRETATAERMAAYATARSQREEARRARRRHTEEKPLEEKNMH